jgi:hypothetical protein
VEGVPNLARSPLAALLFAHSLFVFFGRLIEELIGRNEKTELIGGQVELSYKLVHSDVELLFVLRED